MEQDFTTDGNRGALGCPFAKHGVSNSFSHPHSWTSSTSKEHSVHRHVDPIAAELNQDGFASPPPSASGSASKCPIRYLDQHSPEEVAQYFENHKHEIPRSHELCVKHYQSNSESIRRLDAKYGNLVSMIQGLGMKHQPLLPTDIPTDDPSEERVTNERVEEWANHLSGSERDETEELRNTNYIDREGRFQRSLKEVRVGESPSRPWGISVPLNDIPKPDFTSVQDESKGKTNGAMDRRDAHSEKPRRNIFNSSPSRVNPTKASNKVDNSEPELNAEPRAAVFSNEARDGNPPMIFTGPVFIGYSPDQALALLQGLERAKQSAN